MAEIRYQDADGQLVTVNGKLAYRWRGRQALEVGEDVWLPGNEGTKGQPWRGRVTALGTDYPGAIRNITDRLR